MPKLTAAQSGKLAELANTITEHQHAADLLKSEADVHHAKIRQAEDEIRKVLGSYAKDVPAGSLKIDWSRPRRTFDLPGFITAYPPTTNPHMYKTVTVPDADLIPPKLKDNFMIPGAGEGTVKVK